jgi:protein TonB
MVTDNIQLLTGVDYGAPELKKLYQKFFSRGLIYAVLAHAILLGSYRGIMAYMDAREMEQSQTTQQRIINLTDLEPPPSATEEETPPPQQIEEITQAPPKDLTALMPEPVAKEKAEEQTIKTQQELEEIKSPVSNVGDENSKFQYTGPVKVEEKKIEEKIEKKKEEPVEKSVYQQFEVEKAPEAVNLGQVKASMDYPAVAREAGIEGRVTVKVLVGTSGNVERIGGVTGPDVFHSEVRDKAMNLQFTPGLQNGRPVKVWVTVPFNFKLKSN